MLIGLGTDIIPVEIIRSNMHRDAYLRKLFTDHELAECWGKRRTDQYLAGKFAVKEAFMKALGSGIRQGIWFTQIEVLETAPSCLTVTVTGRAASLHAQIGSPHIQVSQSYHSEFALAVVILEANDRESR
jgi:holo-[acyl-carrier protein] synthase